MSSLKELLGFEGDYFSITVAHCVSVKESLAMCYQVNEHNQYTQSCSVVYTH